MLFLLNIQKFDDYPLEKLIPYIDWNPFFNAWQLRGIYFVFTNHVKGKFPNRGYPKIFNDPEQGEEAKKLFNEAQKMLQEIVSKKLLTARGVIGFYPANSIGEDIEVYSDEERKNKIATFFGLRQQAESVSIYFYLYLFLKDASAYLSIGDFVAPKSTGLADHIGLFAISTGFGVPELEQKYQQQHDDYSIIMLKALADRLVFI